MLLPPPGLLSMITGWPSLSDSQLAMMRASTSVVPPGGYGTTHLIGLFGYCCAKALPAKASRAIATTRTKRCIETLLIGGSASLKDCAPAIRPSGLEHE